MTASRCRLPAGLRPANPALLDTRERELQEAILHGPPPLGPGAGPPARLTAFVGAYLDYLLEHLELVRMSETAAPGARYRIGAYRFWHRHVAILLNDSPDPLTRRTPCSLPCPPST